MAFLTPMAGPVIVDQPAVGNIRYGLYTAANGPFDLPTHGAIGGVQYQQEHCGQGHLLAAASCGTPTIGIGTLDGCDATAIGLPFEAVATMKAGAFPYTAEEVERRLRIRLNDNEQYIAEQAFWGGTADVQPVVQRTELNGNTNTNNPGILDVTPTPGTAVTLEYGVGLLEDALSQYSYPGIFHARPLVSPYAAERSLAPIPVRAPKGTVLPPQLTPMGNVWSFGRGYSGNHPVTGAAPANGTAYIVATGAVSIWRDPDIYVNPPEKSFDRSGNAWQATAQRAMAITIDCVAFFVLVGLDAMTASTGAATAGRLY
jgi:hypothetical protein